MALCRPAQRRGKRPDRGECRSSKRYDGRGYRMQKVIAGGDTFDYYQNEQNQVIEVRRNGSANAYEQYVWDQRYIDASVMVYRDTNTDGTVDQKLYVAQDANFDLTATINGNSGAVVNRFVYTPYGARSVYTATWTAGSTDFWLGHQGLMLDAETGMYYNRGRQGYHPTLGTFTSRDSLGYIDGFSLMQYCGSNPTRWTDPQGTAMWGTPERVHFDPGIPTLDSCDEEGSTRDKILDKGMEYTYKRIVSIVWKPCCRLVGGEFKPGYTVTTTYEQATLPERTTLWETCICGKWTVVGYVTDGYVQIKKTRTVETIPCFTKEPPALA